jgi:LmbE family N-acetylglucosaminyl deacetylase
MGRILAIHAHPDDCEILAGGTLALLADRGHDLTIATMTPGDCGSRELRPEEIAAVRRKEAAAAAAMIGARYLCLEMRDLRVFNDDESRRRVTEVLRQTRPELILTSSPVDYLCDHEATSVLVRDACFAAPAPNYRTGGTACALDGIPHLYFMDSIEGMDREGRLIMPDFVVNVSRTFERKRAMLAAHASQREWLKRHHGTDDYLEQMERWTAARGKLAHVAHGEGFRLYRGHPYPQSRLMEVWLGPAVVKI